MEELGHRFYLLALSSAKRGDLSDAARLAYCALSLDSKQDKARRLLGICLYEFGDTQNAASILAQIPELSDAAREAHERTVDGLSTVAQLIRRGKWRQALKAAENIPHQSVRLLNIRGCILAGEKRYVKAGRLFALAEEKDRGGHNAPGYLRETAKRVKFFWEAR